MTRRYFMGLVFFILRPRRSPRPSGGYYTNPWDVSATELNRYHPGVHPLLVHHEWVI